MSKQQSKQICLGIDLGPNSIGWALIELKGQKPVGLVATGARVFEAGLEGLKTDGRGVSRNVARRKARLTRRGLERRARRMRKLANILQRAGLFPEGGLHDSQTRHLIFNDLDKTMGSPYDLRARALDTQLSPLELGRALYHLAQRRGFLSNRKAPMKSDEDLGTVKTAIGELAEQMSLLGARTLGKYFAQVDPHIERVRGRYTSRQMYEDEFEAIWVAQRSYHPQILTDDLKAEIRHAIFHQRWLKNQKGLIGECELERGRKRAPWALLETQQFRYLQVLNNLRILNAPGRTSEHLEARERATLVRRLENNGDLTFAQARRELGLPRTSKFNYELGGEKKIPGNRTAGKLVSIFGLEGWLELSETDRCMVVEDVRSIVKSETLKRRGMSKWGLSKSDAEKLSEVSLEDGYCSFSRQAIEKLLPLLEAGESLSTAVRELYPDRWERDQEPHDTLPPIRSDMMPELRNPIVERSLTELRKIVNAIIAKHGRPDIIRIELGRDLRQSAKHRAETTKSTRQREGQRKKAAKRLREEAGIENPGRVDILKILLADECTWKCPYTDKSISMASLVGDHPQFDIEHIIPFDRCLDDSYLNKTLCEAEENRKVKRSRTPQEAYGATDKWDDILKRVKKFKGKAGYAKLRRFKATTEDVQEMMESFTSRQLNDMRYASRRAKEYLGLLYGGIDDDGIDNMGKRRVQATVGMITAFLRGEWGLNGILGDGPGKSRDDHRHHAVDAVVVGLTDAAAVKQLSEAAGRAAAERRRLFGTIKPPWDSFQQDVRASIGSLIVSHRVDRRVRGPLHEQTFYGTPHTGDDGKQYVHVRKPLASLSSKDVDKIVDDRVRQVVRDALADLGVDPKKAFAGEADHPSISLGDGRTIAVHRVSIKKALATFPVGEGHRRRHVKSDTNHHMEILEQLDDEGNTVGWDGVVVSLFQAALRLRRGEPIIQREHGPKRCFLFSLACGDIIELDQDDGPRGLFVVRTVPKSRQLRWVSVHDAQKLTDISKVGQTAYPNGLRIRNCRKATISSLGEVRYAAD